MDGRGSIPCVPSQQCWFPGAGILPTSPSIPPMAHQERSLQLGALKMPLIPQLEPVCSRGSGVLEWQPHSCRKQGNFARFGAISLHPCLCCGQHRERQKMALD